MKFPVKYIILAVVAFLFIACGGRLDGERMLNFLQWIGERPKLALVICTVVVSPLLALIPGVGVPISAAFMKIALAVIPTLEKIADAVEEEEDNERKDVRDRTLSEAANVVMGRIADNPETKAGRNVVANVVTRVAARRLIGKARKRRLARRGK